MIVVGIDQSYTSTGIVVLNNDKLVEEYIIKPPDTITDVFEKAWVIKNHVSSIITSYNPEKIIIEGLSFGNMGNVTRNLAGLQFMLVTTLKFEKNFNVAIIPPKSLKKFATGNGSCKKDDMVAALPTEIRQHFLDKGYKKTKGLTDLADAYWLGMFGLNNK